MKINNGIYYCLHNEGTYVINSKHHKKYFFSEIAFYILETLEQDPTLEELYHEMCSICVVDDEGQFLEDIKEFVGYLQNELIISSPSPESPKFATGSPK